MDFSSSKLSNSLCDNLSTIYIFLYALEKKAVLWTSHHVLKWGKKNCLDVHVVKQKIIKFSILIAGKHVRVWTGSCSAVLHRSPSLYSAYSSSFSSLTHTDALTDIFHLVGLRLGSNSNCKILLFDLQTAHGTIVLGKKKREKTWWVRSSVFCLIAHAFVGVSGLECKI